MPTVCGRTNGPEAELPTCAPTHTSSAPESRAGVHCRDVGPPDAPDSRGGGPPDAPDSRGGGPPDAPDSRGGGPPDGPDSPGASRTRAAGTERLFALGRFAGELGAQLVDEVGEGLRDGVL